MAIKPITWHLADFAGGIDTRDGQLSERQNAFRELTNLVLTNGKKLRRRWPYIDPGITLPTNSQGLLAIGPALHVVQSRADYDSTLGGLVTALPFDMPDNYGAGWELVDHAVFQTVVLALIRHDHPNPATPKIVRLHVLGGDRTDGPTYVEDPYCPSNWKNGTTGSPKASTYVETWDPRLTVAQGKVYIGGANGDVHFCKTGNPRAWNVKTIVNLTEFGQELSLLVPATASPIKHFTLHEFFDDFQLETLQDKVRFTAYVLEWYDEYADAWTVMSEVNIGPTADRTYRLTRTTNRWGVVGDEARIELRWTGAPAMLRFRMILADRTLTLSGQVLTVVGTSILGTAGTDQITRDGVVTAYDTGPILSTPVTAASTWIAADDTGTKTAFGTSTPSAVAFTSTVPNGSVRWHNHIIAYVNLAAGVVTTSKIVTDDAWQGVRKIALALYAGDADAGYITTSGHPGADGSAVTALAVLRQRMLVFYPRSTQLWQLGPLAADHQLVDTGVIGTGTQPTPESAPLDQSVVIATPQGLRQYSIESLQVAYINEIGIGDQLRRLSTTLAVPTQRAAAYWPWTGEYVTAVELDGVEFLLGYDYAPTSEVAGWSKWTVNAFAAPVRKGLVPIDQRLYVRSGDTLRCFDATATTYRDVTDPVGKPAYESRAKFAFNDFKSPSTLKIAHSIDVVQVGVATYSMLYQPANELVRSPSVTIPGTSMGRGTIPFPATGPALALVLTSTDETGFELQSVAIQLSQRSR